jgi:hypothetical protein
MNAYADELERLATRRIRLSDPALAYEQLDDLRASLLGLAKRMKSAGAPVEPETSRPAVKGSPETLRIDRRLVTVEVRRRRA